MATTKHKPRNAEARTKCSQNDSGPATSSTSTLAQRLADEIRDIRRDLDSMTCRMTSAKAICETIIMGSDGKSGSLADAVVVLMDKATEEVQDLLGRLDAVAAKAAAAGGAA